MIQKRIKVSFTQQSKMTVADTTVEYVQILESGEQEKFINDDILNEASKLQHDAQLKAVALTQPR